jgi:hypothetical protein
MWFILNISEVVYVAKLDEKISESQELLVWAHFQEC